MSTAARLANQKRYRDNHKEQLREYRRRYYQEHKDLLQQKLLRWRMKNRAKTSGYTKNSHQRIKLEVILYYSNGAPKCACCGESIFVFLTIDHENGRKAVNHDKKMGSIRLYRWLKKNNYPEGYSVMCFNCNISKGLFGTCPHKLRNMTKVELNEKPKSIAFVKIPTTEAEVAQAKTIKNKDLPVSMQSPIFG